MNCPLCVDEVLQANHTHGIEVDVCPRCRGIWLDRGEIDRLAVVAPPPPAAPRDAHLRDDPGHRHARYEHPEAPKPKKKGKKSRKKRLAEQLGDVLEEVLDL